MTLQVLQKMHIANAADVLSSDEPTETSVPVAQLDKVAPVDVLHVVDDP